MSEDPAVLAKADREPTTDEELVAEASAKAVDLVQVAQHAKEMAERGANVKGEGQIESD